MRIRSDRWVRGAAVTALALTMGACATNPVTGRSQLSLVSEAQEIQMGQQAAQEVASSIGVIDDAAMQTYVQRVGEALAARSERPHLPWTFRVVDDPTPNAFALPGGYIFITRGLLSIMDSEAELASVIGHEIGHVTARHSVTQISRGQLAQIGLVLGQIFVPQTQALGGLAESGIGLLFLKYGRDAERQADDLGFRYALSERYDVREMADVFAALQMVGEQEGQSRLPTWLASHPDPGERIQRVQSSLDTLSAPLEGVRIGAMEYFERIDNLVYGENPRAGFFRDGVFYHPEMRFRIDFPRGWQTRNMAQAVLAASPQQDGLIELTLAEVNGAQAAAERFLGQQGIQQLRTTRETVQGLPAIVSYFQAATQQGEVRGLVGFIEHQGRTFQILGYAPAASFSTNQLQFQQTLASFRQLTDQAALNAQPNRIDVMRVPSTMTLTEFNRRNPSVIEIDELAVINQLEGADATIPAGTMIKRVVAGG